MGKDLSGRLSALKARRGAPPEYPVPLCHPIRDADGKLPRGVRQMTEAEATARGLHFIPRDDPRFTPSADEATR